jgi:DNA-binding CsgD family transcriptional regulator
MWIRGSAEASGLASLTLTELDVARIVEIHLAHVYSKLGLTSHVPLAQQAARHS